MKIRNVLKFGGGNEQAEIIEEDEPQKNYQKNSIPSAISFASNLGFIIALPIAGGAFLGQFLDNKFGTSPGLTLAFIVVGIFLAFTGIFFRLREIIEK